MNQGVRALEARLSLRYGYHSGRRIPETFRQVCFYDVWRMTLTSGWFYFQKDFINATPVIGRGSMRAFILFFFIFGYVHALLAKNILDIESLF